MEPVRLRRARSHLARGLRRGYGTSRGRGRYATRVEGALRSSERPGEGRGHPWRGDRDPTCLIWTYLVERSRFGPRVSSDSMGSPPNLVGGPAYSIWVVS